MRTSTFIHCCAVVLIATTSYAQTVSSLSPRAVAPGSSSAITVTGADLNDTLRCLASNPDIHISLEKVEPTQATIQVNVPKDTPLGPHGMLLAAAAGPLSRQILLIDDLPSVADNGSNHTRNAAQAIAPLASIAGTCDASASDFYKLTAEAGQRISLEILTQPLLSAMDPVLRLTDANGQTLVLADDDSAGPDIRFSHTFADAGEYFIEVFDSRHAAAGSTYQLRVGDFPVIHATLPLAIQAGNEVEVWFTGPDADALESQRIKTRQTSGNVSVAAKFKDGSSSAWSPLAISPYRQLTESSIDAPLEIPIGISGQLSAEAETDVYTLVGHKGQMIRVAARTRSLGCPTLLTMKLINAAGAVIAETKVTESDEWSFDATLPEDGNYELQVTDLLHRGGLSFAYWIEIATAGSFNVALKADASVAEQFALEPSGGAAPIDLTIQRLGYDGPIEVDFLEPVPGVSILNPTIATGANEARIYLHTDDNWNPDQIAEIHLTATASDPATGTQAYQVVIDSRQLQRVKLPHVLSLNLWSDGLMLLGGATKSDGPFTLEPTTPLQFARPVNSHVAALTLKRTNDAFKRGNLASAGPARRLDSKAAADKDNYTATFTAQANTKADGSELAQLPVSVFADVAGRGRVETVTLPIEWIDPASVQLSFPEPVLRGGRATVHAEIVRQGSDPQPVTLSVVNPTGFTGPEPIVVAADQTAVDFQIQLSTDTPADAALTVTVASKYKGQDYSVQGPATTLPVVDGPVQLAIFPPVISLSDARARQQVVVSGTDANHQPRDWTRFAHFTVAKPEIASIEDGVVRPKADGQTELIVEVGGLKQVLPLSVSGASKPRPVAFESEALVALSKQGCNSGACHGSPSGKGGFRLSLRAFDMQLDELTLVREDFGRRVNVLDPEQSLLLLKPLMKVTHGGGKQLRQDDVAYQLLKDWVAEGAQIDSPGTPRIERLEIFPSQKQVLSVADGGQQLAITAHFTDGSSRDVTDLAAYETSSTSVATVDVRGFVTPHGRGEVAVLVRFLEHIESIPLMFVEQSADFHWAAPTANNYIDELVNAKLQQLQYVPAETCSDAEFLRRVSLDITGVLPSVDVTQAFLQDVQPDKRARLVDTLLESEEYPKFWALKWGDLLRMTSKLVGDDGVHKYHRWVEESLRDNMPYDEFAQQLLTGSGSTLSNPPANFYRTATDMNECVETISQVFLGARLQCAKCHNHPFERWTQDNYYGLGAFFNRVERRKTSRPGEMFVYTAATGDVTQPRTGKLMAPWLPQKGSIDPAGEADRREAFAQWLIAPDNPYFARIEANRIWSQLFARGIVDPIDDFRDSNPPSNAPLLDALAKDFIDSGYDRKHLLRTILASRTYQASYLTNEWNREDQLYFSHQEPRLLSAEQLLDAINMTLALSQNFGSLPAGTRATQLPAPDLAKVDFLKTFGQPERSTVCACERTDDSNLGMAIELFNGPMMHEKLRDPNNRFRQRLGSGVALPDILTELYLAAVCRPPSELELKTALEHCGKSDDQAAGLEDVCWALFNTDEFLFQH
ncbi:MAG: DUF1549 domain-containing protein [Pirellulaceae bacterium]